jgi:hypothetical protein
MLSRKVRKKRHDPSQIEEKCPKKRQITPERQRVTKISAIFKS